MSKTVVLVGYSARPDRIEEALAAVGSLMSTVQSLEVDCGGITMLQDSNDPTRIALVEQWPGQDVLLGPRMQQLHLRSFIWGAAAFLSGPPGSTFWRPVHADKVAQNPLRGWVRCTQEESQRAANADRARTRC